MCCMHARAVGLRAQAELRRVLGPAHRARARPMGNGGGCEPICRQEVEVGDGDEDRNVEERVVLD